MIDILAYDRRSDSYIISVNNVCHLSIFSFLLFSLDFNKKNIARFSRRKYLHSGSPTSPLLFLTSNPISSKVVFNLSQTSPCVPVESFSRICSQTFFGSLFFELFKSLNSFQLLNSLSLKSSSSKLTISASSNFGFCCNSLMTACSPLNQLVFPFSAAYLRHSNAFCLYSSPLYSM